MDPMIAQNNKITKPYSARHQHRLVQKVTRCPMQQVITGVRASSLAAAETSSTIDVGQGEKIQENQSVANRDKPIFVHFFGPLLKTNERISQKVSEQEKNLENQDIGAKQLKTLEEDSEAMETNDVGSSKNHKAPQKLVTGYKLALKNHHHKKTKGNTSTKANTPRARRNDQNNRIATKRDLDIVSKNVIRRFNKNMEKVDKMIEVLKQQLQLRR